MKKISIALLLITFAFFSAACSNTEESKPEAESESASSGSSSLQDKLTANAWNIMYNDQSYGTIKMNADGSCKKEADGGGMESTGTWSLDGNILTLNFPEEGDPFSGPVTVDGENLTVVFMDGMITYTYTPVK